MSKYTILIIILFYFSSSFGQNFVIPPKLFSCQQIERANDSEYCLYAGKVEKIDLLCSPKGSGEKQEIKANKSDSKSYFEKEHNVVWIKFTALKTGKLLFKINPKSSDNDYDFMLFKDEGVETKNKIYTKEIKPIRSNLARTINIENGVTGLKFDANQKTVGEGKQTGFSQYVDVIEGENYYLVLDNVYDNGAGAIITFEYFDFKTIAGKVENEEKQAIEADIIWEDKLSGEELARTKSNPKTGEFEIDVPFNANSNKEYVLIAESDSSFFTEKYFTAKEVQGFKPTPINIILPKLKGGKRLKLYNINFEGGKSDLLSTAYPSLERLLKLMKRNPSLHILIEGHTNGCPGNSRELSDSRSLVVKNYLVERKIKSERITTVGLDCQFMLYPLNSSEYLQSMNRRVEIVVTKY